MKSTLKPDEPPFNSNSIPLIGYSLISTGIVSGEHPTMTISMGITMIIQSI